MSDEKVTIDPGYRPAGRSRDGGEHRTLMRSGVAATIVVIFVLGLMLGSPAPTPEDTSPPPLVVTPTSYGFVAAAPTTGWPSLVISDVPLQEMVPGFVDTITTLLWSHEGVEVLRWRAPEPGPATVLSLRHDDGGLSRGVDASGRWLAEVQGDSGLTVRHLVDTTTSDRERPIWAADGVRTWAPVWHDTSQGRLAWLACQTERPGSAVALHTADVTGDVAEPVGLPLVDFGCAHQGVWLVRWGDWGMLLHASEGSDITQVLIDAEGTQIARGRLGPDGEWFVGAGPRGTIWTEGLGRTGASSYLLSPDGLRRRPVPGLAEGERLESATGSPDGALLALVPDLIANYGSVVRIVDADTGSVVAEIAEPSWWVTRMVWSTDSRFLVYERWPDITANWAGVPQDVELVFYDTKARAGVAIPLPGYAPALRSAA